MAAVCLAHYFQVVLFKSIRSVGLYDKEINDFLSWAHVYCSFISKKISTIIVYKTIVYKTSIYDELFMFHTYLLPYLRKQTLVVVVEWLKYCSGRSFIYVSKPYIILFPVFLVIRTNMSTQVSFLNQNYFLSWLQKRLGWFIQTIFALNSLILSTWIVPRFNLVTNFVNHLTFNH